MIKKRTLLKTEAKQAVQKGIVHKYNKRWNDTQR